jgi:hypothetical protein
MNALLKHCLTFFLTKNLYFAINQTCKFTPALQLLGGAWLCKCAYTLHKGTLTRDFRPLVFFIKQLPLGP